MSLARGQAVLQVGGTLVGLILLVAGLRKLQEGTEGFRQVVRAHRILPDGLVPWVAPIIPWLEIAAGLGMLVSRTRSFAASLSVVLLTGFSVSLAINLLRGRRDIPCGCFGTGMQSKDELSWILVVRNLVLAGLAAGLIASGSSRAEAPLPSLLLATTLLAFPYLLRGVLQLHRQNRSLDLALGDELIEAEASGGGEILV